MGTDIGEITQMLNDAADGDAAAAQNLWVIAQAEIRGQAEMLVARERASDDIQPTLLVNEAWLKIHGNASAPPQFGNRREFYGAIWRVMRQILIDYARARNSLKRGGNHRRVDLDLAAGGLRQLDTLGDSTDALLPALDNLRELDPTGFDVFWGRFALGLTREQVGDMMGIDTAEVDTHWRHARAWLRTRIEEHESNE